MKLRGSRALSAAALLLAVGALAQTGAATANAEPTGEPGATETTTTATATPTAVPVAVNDAAVADAGVAKTINVLANDTDADPADVLTIADGFDTLGGRVTRSADKRSLVFTATAADAGKTLPGFTYAATDGKDSSARATVSVRVNALPARTVTISLPATVATLRPYTISGAVRPTVPGPVTVAVQRRSGTKWVAYKSDRASGGTYGVPFTSGRTKTYSFRAVASWDDGRRAVSSTLTRTVVPRMDIVVSGPLDRSDVPYSYRSGCPVAPSGLRRITMNRFTYTSGTVARGSLIVRANAVSPMLDVFKASFAKRFRLKSMRPSDAFYAGGSRTPTQSDVAAMNADNTSAFNCRPVTGNPYRVSQHSYGNAIDINTVRNPYVVGSRVYPSFARTYLNRSNVRTGMITRRGVIATRMRANGWPWGARWSHPDYQHFSANGG